jgi:hypothetical protein
MIVGIILAIILTMALAIGSGRMIGKLGKFGFNLLLQIGWQF